MAGPKPLSAHSHENNRSWETNRKALWAAIAITAVVMIVEIIGGYLANSLALLSDAGHMLTDVMALLLSLIAIQLAVRPPSLTKTFGLYRM